VARFITKTAADWLVGKCTAGRQRDSSYTGAWVRVVIDGDSDWTKSPVIYAKAIRSPSPVTTLEWERFDNYAYQDVLDSFTRENKRLAQQKKREDDERKRIAEIQRQEYQRKTAQAAAERRAVEIQTLKTNIEQRWSSHMNKMFSGEYIIENVGDLLQYNRAKAISLLSDGVTLKLNTRNMSFQDGTVIIADEHDPTDIYRPVREAELASMREMDRFLRQTQTVGTDFSGPSVNVICRLDANALEQLDGKGSGTFRAKMQSLTGRSAVFDCNFK
jgi:hypothetical protein